MQEKFGTKNTKDSNNPSLSIVYSRDKGDSTHSRVKPNSILSLYSTPKCELISKTLHPLQLPATALQYPQYPVLK